MSRLYFHSPSSDAELLGSERAWLGSLASGPARAAWNLDGASSFERACEIVDMVPEVPDGEHGANYLRTYRREAQAQDTRNKATYAAWTPGSGALGHTSHDLINRFVSALEIRLRVDGVDLDVAGHRLRSSNVGLNTALAAGSDPVRLAAKLHGWCEIHAWVEGPDRAWLAGIIDEGLRAGMYRKGLWYADQPDGARDKWSPLGWEQVLELLRARDDEPVVTSYSVCDQFPNQDVADWEPTVNPSWVPDWAVTDGRNEWDEMSAAEQDSYRRDHARDSWYDLPAERRWELAMAGLRRVRPWARFAPDTLAEVTFGPSVTVFDLFAADRDERVRAACALEAVSA